MGAAFVVFFVFFFWGGGGGVGVFFFHSKITKATKREKTILSIVGLFQGFIVILFGFIRYVRCSFVFFNE